ncbi:MAG: hypothetical protein BMS9Abin28_1252 [Anaerolineae bacterium]|nr:MAG: hypothetical protein BMS9Abin28_1252 [Anaerolineae bacterium]
MSREKPSIWSPPSIGEYESQVTCDPLPLPITGNQVNQVQLRVPCRVRKAQPPIEPPMIHAPSAVQSRGSRGLSQREGRPLQEVAGNVVQGTLKQRIEKGRIRWNPLGGPAVIVIGMRFSRSYLTVPVLRTDIFSKPGILR